MAVTIKYSVNHMICTNVFWEVTNYLFCEVRSQKLHDAMMFTAYLMGTLYIVKVSYYLNPFNIFFFFNSLETNYMPFSIKFQESY